MAETIAEETRALLKERFPYPIFLYEAEKVGITATGEQDQNELSRTTTIPPAVEKTCLELYQSFGTPVSRRPPNDRRQRRAYVVQLARPVSLGSEIGPGGCFTARPSVVSAAKEFYRRSTEIVYAAREPDHEWPVYGVNNKEGVFFSHFQKGRAFNTPYKRISEDWFFHNPTRANVGSRSGESLRSPRRHY